jgi:hypothetical protein
MLKSGYAYSMGFSTHVFFLNLNNFKNAVTYYKPHRYVVLEMQNVVFDMRELENVVNSELEKLPSFDHRLLSWLQRMPYLRLGYRQIKFFTGFHVVDMLRMFAGNDTESEPEEKADVIEWDRIAIFLDSLMADIRQVCVNNGIDLILIYHPRLTIDKGGYASADRPNEYLLKIKNACSNNGIYFMDMTDVFIAEYDTYHLLPHGFSIPLLERDI